MRDFFSQEMGKAFVPDRYIDIFQGRAPKNVLARHYNPHGTGMLRQIYDKANLNVLNKLRQKKRGKGYSINPF